MHRRVRVAAATLLLVASFDARCETIELSCDNKPTTAFLPPYPEEVRVAFKSSGGWLRFEERGQQISVRAPASGHTLRISQPLRYGFYWARVGPGDAASIARAEGTASTGSFGITPMCDISAERIAWLRKLDRLDHTINEPLDQAGLIRAGDELAALEGDAPDRFLAAVAAHYLALAQSNGGDARRGAQLFAAAASRWSNLGDSSRALAAKLGEIDASYAGGDVGRLLRETDGLAQAGSALGYFEARMLNDRCLALDDMGKFEQASVCLELTLAALRRLGETPEYASTLKNLANVRRKQGKLREARGLALDALSVVSGPYAPMTRGRLHLLLAAIERQQGDPARSLRRIEQAQLELAGAGSGALYWRAASRLEQARLYEELGSYYEAYAALADASSMLTPQDSLGERARIFADLESDTGRVDSARFWYRVAENAFAEAGMTPAWDVTRLARMQLDVAQNNTVDAELALTEPHELPLYVPQWLLLAAHVALQTNRLEEAQKAIGAARDKPLSLRDTLRSAVFEAQIRDRFNDSKGADHLLMETAERVRQLATRAGNPVLRHVIARETSVLRRAAAELLLARADAARPDITAAALAAWFDVAPTLSSQASGGSKRAATEAFDRAVAADLLSNGGAGRNGAELLAQRELLRILARDQDDSTDVARADHETMLAALQHELEPGVGFAAYIDAGSRGALLWITRDAAESLPAAAPGEVRSQSIILGGLLRTADTPLADVELAAGRLSAMLLGAIPVKPPRRLYVLADDISDSVAWSTLRWPGVADDLIQTTIISVVRLEMDAAAIELSKHPIHVIVADQESQPGAKLTPLNDAGSEADLIARSASRTDFPVQVDAHGTRSTLLSAFAVPGAWVHVAAHGHANPARIGYAGVWLEPETDDPVPPFLSWLDVLNSGVRSDLVVLDACRLGDSGSNASANMSFAAAVLESGARRVIAAMWPVSDSAAALWVPTFYSTLVADPQHDVARALRTAQLRLRESRTFRHPFFWASLQTRERLALPASAVANQ